MKYWLVISNNKFFRLDDYLEERTSVTWRQTNNFEVGDKVAEHFTDEEAYWTNPHDYIAAVMANRFCEFSLVRRFNPESMPLRLLKMHGLVTPRGNMQLEGDLLNFILSTIDGSFLKDIEPSDIPYPTEVHETDAYNEGAVMQVTVNRYERNREARDRCIEAKGCKCAICGMDFEQTYGDIGKGFIHVHHLIPISSMDYVIDPINHLVPVCPNCHNMLHRKDPPYTPEELKEKISKTKINKLHHQYDET